MVTWTPDATATLNLEAGVYNFEMSHRFQTAGEYTVLVTVADDGGDEVTRTFKVNVAKVMELKRLYLPIAIAGN